PVGAEDDGLARLQLVRARDDDHVAVDPFRGPHAHQHLLDEQALLRHTEARRRPGREHDSRDHELEISTRSTSTVWVGNGSVSVPRLSILRTTSIPRTTFPSSA